MYGLRDIMEKEYSRLKRLETKAKQQLKELPKGTVRISKSNNRIQFYYKEENTKNKNGKYLPQSETKLAYQLSQRQYDEHLLMLIQKRMKQLSRILNDYQDNEIENVFYKETVLRQQLIEPLEKTWERELSDWIQLEYTQKAFGEKDPEIYADKGHRVRSKTEKMLADYFYRNHIPYHYEKPLYLAGYGVIYPDFTFYSPTLRCEIYWEHEGMMDDVDYVNKTIKKLESYEKNGIFVGERLIITQETGRAALKTSDIERKVKRYLTI